MIDRQRKISNLNHHQFFKGRIYRIAHTALCSSFEFAGDPSIHGSAIISFGSAATFLGRTHWSAPRMLQHGAEASRDAGARSDVARVTIDASDEFGSILSAAHEKSPDERYSYLYSAVSDFLAKFENLGLVEVAFELTRLRYPEDILGEVLEMLGEIGDYRTLRYRRAIVREALTARSAYLRFAAVSAADDLGLAPNDIKALLEREEIVELQERAKSVLRALENRATD